MIKQKGRTKRTLADVFWVYLFSFFYLISKRDFIIHESSEKFTINWWYRQNALLNSTTNDKITHKTRSELKLKPVSDDTRRNSSEFITNYLCERSYLTNTDPREKKDFMRPSKFFVSLSPLLNENLSFIHFTKYLFFSLLCNWFHLNKLLFYISFAAHISNTTPHKTERNLRINQWLIKFSYIVLSSDM